MSFSSLVRRVPVLAILGLATSISAAIPSAVAQYDQAKSGPVVFRNLTSRAVKLEKVSYVSPAGVETALAGSWELKPGFFGYLGIADQKIRAREFACDIVDSDGTTRTKWVANQLDKDGDFVLLFQESDWTEHRRVLGKAPAAPSRRQPTDEEVGRGIAKVLAAALAQAVVENRINNGDGGLGDAILIEVLRGARDEAIQSALGDLFPELSAREKADARRMISLALDGNLNVDSYNEQAAKERLIAQLRAQNPDFGSAAEVADFIYRVSKAKSNR